MTFNLPEKWRGILYVICTFGSLIALYLGARGLVGVEELSLWSGFTAAVAGIAGFNLGNSPRDTTPTDDAIVMRRPNQ